MTNANKVTLPRDVAEAIERYLNEFDKERLLKAHGDSGEWVDDDRQALNKIDLMTLASALVNGYEVEKSPEERVLKFYLEGDVPYQWMSEKRRIIKTTLDLLGIKIEGVNAE